jgi:exopolysaccharide biosynthesis polyprenyl glycosylphosphotransferase
MKDPHYWGLVYRRALPLLDLVLVIVAFRLAYTLRYDLQLLKAVDESNLAAATFREFLPYAFLYGFWLIATWPVAGLYREKRGRSWFEEVTGILNGATNATVVVMAFSFLLRPQVFSRLLILEATALVIIILSSVRLIHRAVKHYLRARGVGVERVLVVGAGEGGRAVLSAIIARPDLGYVPVGYLDDRPDRGLVNMGRVKGLGDLDQLEPVLVEYGADLVIIALPWAARQRIMDLMTICERFNIPARVVPDLLQLNLSQVSVENLEGIPLLGMRSVPRFDRPRYLIKRAIDFIVIILCTPILLPLMLLIALAIKFDSPGPILFTQRRVGKDGREFKMFKFRSMHENADAMRQELIEQTGADPKRPKWENDPRITRVGKWIRRTSIDELPQILNILRGEMSVVGPRPPTPDEVTHYETWHRQRLNILPGATSLWQVSGRSKVPFEEQCLLDIYYIENWSIALDIQIMLRTIPNVLLGNGAY